MNAAMPVSQAYQIVASNPELAGQVGRCMSQSQLPAKDYNTARQCAAYLYRTDWRNRYEPVCGGASLRQQKKAARKDACRRLQTVGILPTGIEWFILSWALRRFLNYLVDEWMFKGEA